MTASKIAKNHHGHTPPQVIYLPAQSCSCSKLLPAAARDQSNLFMFEAASSCFADTPPLGGAVCDPIKGDDGRCAGSYRLRTSVNIFDQLK
jgi:hypothetical protein